MFTRTLISLGLAMVLSLPGTAGAAPRGQNFDTPLTGEEEVPPRETRARGQLTLQLSADESTFDYRLIVSNISNVTAAHIHCGPAGVNGPVKQFLYGDVAPGGGRTDGVLAEGTFPTPTGDCAGTSFLDAIRSGLTYVNVHTNDGVAPTNTGPGDFPGGEIRGQIESRGPGE
ncbi:MAG: CHRD domain-containing protein [Actinomycetota bacterium]